MGTLAAMGMKGRQVMGLFVLEGAFIGPVGAVIGCIAGWLLVMAVGRTGIDFSSFVEGIEDAGEIYALMGNASIPTSPVQPLFYMAWQPQSLARWPRCFRPGKLPGRNRGKPYIHFSEFAAHDPRVVAFARRVVKLRNGRLVDNDSERVS